MDHSNALLNIPGQIIWFLYAKFHDTPLLLLVLLVVNSTLSLFALVRLILSTRFQKGVPVTYAANSQVADISCVIHSCSRTARPSTIREDLYNDHSWRGHHLSYSITMLARCLVSQSQKGGKGWNNCRPEH